jgi:hypothetical protein
MIRKRTPVAERQRPGILTTQNVASRYLDHGSLIGVNPQFPARRPLLKAVVDPELSAGFFLTRSLRIRVSCPVAKNINNSTEGHWDPASEAPTEDAGASKIHAARRVIAKQYLII